MAKVVSYSQENPNKDTTPPVFISMHSVVAGACASTVYRRSVSYIYVFALRLTIVYHIGLR